MRSDSIRRALLLPLICLLGGALEASAPALANPIEDAPHQWKARYEAGSAPLGASSGIVLTLREDHLELRHKRNPSFAIALPDIRAVSSNLFERRTAAVDQGLVWESLIATDPQAIFLFPFGAPFLLAAAGIKYHYAYVDIFWTEGNTEQEVLLRLSRHDYSDFMTTLQKASGKEWKNMETEWAKIKQELAGNQGARLPLHLDRGAQVGKNALKTGDYTAVLLTRAPGHGELYIFPGHDVDIEHLAAATSVEVTATGAGAETAANSVSYKDEKGTTFLAEIHTAAQTLRLP